MRRPDYYAGGPRWGQGPLQMKGSEGLELVILLGLGPLEGAQFP